MLASALRKTSRPLALALVAGLLISLVGTAGAARFGNLVNRPFETQASGPVGAVLAAPTRAGEAEALNQVAADLYQLQNSSAVHELIARGVLREEPFLERYIYNLEADQLVLPEWTRSTRVGSGDIAFTYSGWTAGEQTELETYMATAYTLMVAYYGDPAFDITVNVVKDPALQDVRGGTYNPSTNEIRIGYFPDMEMAKYYLTIMALHAFHDDVMFSYEAWETGFARAVAAAVATQAMPTFDITRDTYYVVQLYDCLNQQDLASPTFWSGATSMPLWRLIASQANWLKVYVENPLFFRGFNEAYYAQLSAAGNYLLAGNVPALKQIAAGLAPTVEGVPFYAWYEQQYAMDTSIHLGLKLYVYNVPFADNVFLIYNYHETGADGTDTPRAGRVALDYWDYTFTNSLFANEGYYVDISASGADAGVGFISPSFFNIGGSQRITVEARLSGLVRETIFPYGVRGSDANVKELFGAIIGANSAALTISYGGTDYPLTVTRGVFSLDLTQALRPGKASVRFEPTGENLLFMRNVGYQFYTVLFRASGYTDFDINLPIDGMQLISLPCYPQEEDAAVALGIPASELLLAEWDPEAPSSSKYKLYPKTGPLEPGKGYWLKRDGTLTTTVRGLPVESTSKAGYFEVQLKPGWNIVGTPSESSVAKTDLKFVTSEATELSFAEASQAGLVRSVLWGYSTSGYVQVASLLPYYGYWLKVTASTPITLLIPISRSVLESGRASASEPVGAGWDFSVVASTSAGKRASCMLGAREGATQSFDARYEAEAPPGFADLPSLGALESAWGSDSGLFAIDYQTPNQTTFTWQLELTPPATGDEVTLTWGDLSSLPRDYTATLVDEATGKRVAMRSLASYTPTTRSTTQSFSIEVARYQGSALMATGLMVVPLRGAVEIDFAPTRECLASLVIRNLAGTILDEVATRETVARGQASFGWNKTDGAGRPVPTGTYICELKLEDVDGQKYTTARTFSILAD